MEEIATAAGVTRQTVYAHYSSRDVLLAAVVNEIALEATEALDAIDVDSESAVSALRQWLDASWSLIERHPVLLSPAVSTLPGDDYERHLPVMQRLAELLRRGQRTGEFDDRMPATWLVTAVIGLGQAAGGEVRSGRMTARDAGTAYRESVLRLCARGATDPLPE